MSMRTRATSAPAPRQAGDRPVAAPRGPLSRVAASCAVVLVTGCAGVSPVAQGPRASAPPMSSPGGTSSTSSAAGTARSIPPTRSPSGSARSIPPTPSPSPSPSIKPLAQLPLGGRSIFPKFRVVAYYGSTGGSALGVLGKGTPEQAAAAITRAAAPYAAYGRPIQPAMELIATVAQSHPGVDGSYSYRLPDATINSYLAAARRHKMLLLLDVQPGRAGFLTQVRGLERYLTQPDFGVALDPEWKLTAGQRPLGQIGSSDAAPINAVSAYVAGLVQRHRLPEKLFVLHQFQIRMLPDRKAIVTRPGLAIVDHVDGQGPVSDKLKTYAALTPAFQ